MYKSLALVSAATLLSGEVEGRMSFGKCPEENNMVPFNKERFAGKWFEQVRDPENIYTMSADCVTMEFSQPQSEGRLDAYFRGFYWMMMSYQGGKGSFYDCDSANKDWTCQATMGDSSNLSGFPIFDTDYDNYHISYFCRDMFDNSLMKYEWFSLFTREQSPSDEVMESAKAKVAESLPSYDIDSISNLFLYKTNQNNCEYDW